MSKKPLEECDYVDVSPLYWEPATQEGWLAAAVAYCNGDGTVTASRNSAAFYSQSSDDLTDIGLALVHAGLDAMPRLPIFKKGSRPEFDAYQLNVYGEAARELVSHGAVVGKKVEQEFGIPEWVLKGSDDVKRSFLAALWGAEGTTPALNIKKGGEEMKLPRTLALNMSKRKGVDGGCFFAGLRQMMTDLGVESTVQSADRGQNTTYTLYVSPGVENARTFFTSVGFLFAANKSFNAWLWKNYLDAYVSGRRRLVEDIRSMRDRDGMSFDVIASLLGQSKGKVYQVYRRGAQRSSWDFPGFREWVADRWCLESNLLRLAVVRKTVTADKPVYNVRVDSHDHSYLVGSGLNNFNSFETMSGRVYYAFDRAQHVGKYDFDPHGYIIVGQDFNVDPMTSVIMQWKPSTGELWCIDEIYLNQSNTQEVVDELERRYWRLFPNNIVVFPDPAGANRSSARGETDIQMFTAKGINRIHFRKKHPFVADRINAVNAMLKSADGQVRLRVDAKCKRLIQSLEQTIYKSGTREVDKTQGAEHITDALGYPIEFLFSPTKVKLVGVSR